ncbi:MAG TPA: hypothetical protein VFM46_05320 [Pseudomonadales bacterium]|nr:hypothetical protein [Pseudomonadales bacterium]
MNADQRIDANIDAFLKSTGADPQRIRIQYGEAKVEKMREAMRKIMKDSYIKGSNDHFDAMVAAGRRKK